MDIKKNTLLSRVFNNTDMKIYEIAYAALGNDWNYKCRNSSFTRIYMITKGGGRVIFPERAQELVPGRIYIIPSVMNFECECDSYMEKLYFHVVLPGQSGYDIFSRLPGCAEIEGGGIIEKCIDLFNANSMDAVMRLKHILYDVTLKAFECENIYIGDVDEYSEITRKAISYIDENMKASIKIDEIASSIYVSSSKLKKQFRCDTGVSVGKYIDDKLMFIAENEIRKNKHSIREISEKLGFCDQFYFSRKFSERYGLPPTKYRQSCRT